MNNSKYELGDMVQAVSIITGEILATSSVIVEKKYATWNTYFPRGGLKLYEKNGWSYVLDPPHAGRMKYIAEAALRKIPPKSDQSWSEIMSSLKTKETA